MSPGLRAKFLKTLSTHPPEDRPWLWFYCAYFFGVRIPRNKVCADHTAPFDAFADAYFAVTPVVVWYGSRALSGKSFMLALLGLVIGCTEGGLINILGGSGDQSRNVKGYIQGDHQRVKNLLWGSPHAPRQMFMKAIQSELRFANGGVVRALNASMGNVRGPHPPTLLLDEIDEMTFPIWTAARGQTMATDNMKARTVASSTWQYPDGVMTSAIEEAEEKGWAVHTWCYKENHVDNGGWLTQGMVDNTRNSVTAQMWETEYELNRPNPEDLIFSPDVIDELFDPRLGKFEDKLSSDYVLIEPNPYDLFYMGSDWAKSKDLTAHVCMRTSRTGPDQMALYRMEQRLSWPKMVANFNKIVERYDAMSTYDATGVGAVVEDWKTVQSEPVVFNQAIKHEMFEDHIAGIEAGDWVLPNIPYLKKVYRSVRRNDLFGTGHPPDPFVAGALAYSLSDKRLERKKGKFRLLLGRA